MQFRMAPHQTKKGKHESNTLDVLRTGEGQTATRGQEPLSRFRRFHACGEEFEKFCALVAYGSEGFVTINEFGIAQKL
jgi:hypothetical protein